MARILLSYILSFFLLVIFVVSFSATNRSFANSYLHAEFYLPYTVALQP
ncbi:MAG: hypothetical protein ACI86X_002561 [Moritella sp.]|jgi:hypothetical protein